MTAFPELPPPLAGHAWAPNIIQAHRVLSDVHRHAVHASRQGAADSMRLRFHREAIITDCIPLLIALETHAEEEDLPTLWISQCAESLGTMVAYLQKSEESLQNL